MYMSKMPAYLRLFLFSLSILFLYFLKNIQLYTPNMAAALTSVIIKPRTLHTATVIMIHGLGDSGNGWAPVANEMGLALPYVKWILPNAPSQPVTLNYGMRMPSWFDIVSAEDLRQQEDEEGMLKSVSGIRALLSEEVKAGIPPSRVVLAGFSQGGAISLLTGLTSDIQVAGIIGLSTYLPIRNKIFDMALDANKQIPIFIGHGSGDTLMRYEFGTLSVELLRSKGYNVEFKTYEGMGHSTCPREMDDMTEFLGRVLPPLSKK